MKEEMKEEMKGNMIDVRKEIEEDVMTGKLRTETEDHITIVEEVVITKKNAEEEIVIMKKVGITVKIETTIVEDNEANIAKDKV